MISSTPARFIYHFVLVDDVIVARGAKKLQISLGRSKEFFLERCDKKEFNKDLD